MASNPNGDAAGAAARYTALPAGLPITEAHLRAINPTGSGTNCNECAKALDDFLGGLGLFAADDGSVHSPYHLEHSYHGRQFRPVRSLKDIIEELLKTPGSRGIVYGVREPGIIPDFGHVFNAVNLDGRVIFIDAQSGGEAVTAGEFMAFEFLRTN